MKSNIPETEQIEKRTSETQTHLPLSNHTVELNCELIDLALEKVPTGGNAKPFKWFWLEEQLIIKHVDHFEPHYLTRKNHTLLITLGCFIETAIIAGKHQGYECAYAVNHDDLTGVITFSKSEINSDEDDLYFKLLKRSTYRGPLQASSAPVLSSTLLTEDIQARVAGASSLKASFKKFLADTDAYMWLQTKAAISFFKEVRFFDDRQGPRGIRSADLGVGKFDQSFLYVMSHFPKLLSLLVRMPLFNIPFKKATKRNLHNAHFVLITAKDLSHDALIMSGRQSLRTWLELERKGYCAQPYSTASITLVDAANGALPDDTLKNYRELFNVIGPAECASQFNLAPEEHVVWMFRVGTRLECNLQP